MTSSFRDDFFFLSNFFPAEVPGWGLIFPTAEHAYVAAKIGGSDAQQQRFLVTEIGTAAEAKRFGRIVRLRANWPAERVPAMRAILARKFADPRLAEMLRATGQTELVEHNDWGDTFWGVCRGRGENRLGRLLMEIRG